LRCCVLEIEKKRKEPRTISKYAQEDAEHMMRNTQCRASMTSVTSDKLLIHTTTSDLP
jgi:hypothetical protein